MKIVRLIIRIILVLFWFIIMTPYAIYVHIKNRRKGEWALNRGLSFATRVWGKGLAKILGLKIRVYGNVNDVKGMIISNHLSYVDILTLSSTFKVRFTPKKEIASWPFLGWFIKTSNPIWIDRGSKQAAKKTMKEFADNVNNGINLIIFAEGTTTDGKSGLLPFKSTVFEAVVQEKLISYPVLIKYIESDDVPVAWYGDMTLLGHAIRLLGMKKIEAEIHILQPVEPGDLNRKQLAEKMHSYMNLAYKNI